jgi:hypothetical protein
MAFKTKTFAKILAFLAMLYRILASIFEIMNGENPEKNVPDIARNLKKDDKKA